MRILLIVILMFAGLTSYCRADAKKDHTVRFSAIQQVGLVGNEAETKPMFQLVTGVTWKRYFLGLGAAIDPYFTYSFPLFADARFVFYRQRLNCFVYGAAGVNKLVYSNERFPRYLENGERAFVLHNGLFYDYGLGVQTHLSGNFFYTLSAGISYKETLFDRIYYSWPDRKPMNERYRNIASRFSIKMGLQF